MLGYIRAPCEKALTARHCALSAFSTSNVVNSTYHDLLNELADDSSDTFAGQWILRRRKHDMKMALKHGRDEEEDARYFKRNGKAITLVTRLSELVNGPHLEGMCWGCVSINAIEPACQTAIPDLGLFCTECASIECEDTMINVVFLESLGIATPHGKAGVWPEVIVLQNGMSYLHKHEADRLSMLHYGLLFAERRDHFSPEDHQKVQKDYTRSSVCMKVIEEVRFQYTNAYQTVGDFQRASHDLRLYGMPIEHMVEIQRHTDFVDVTNFQWFCGTFEFAVERYNRNAPTDRHAWKKWARKQVAYWWHHRLYKCLGRFTEAWLQSSVQVISLSHIKNPALTEAHALDHLSCTLEQADVLCGIIHRCNLKDAIELSAKQRRRNLSLYLAEMACVLKAMDMYDDVPSAIQACADLLVLIYNEQFVYDTASARLHNFCNIACCRHLHHFCEENVEVDGSELFQSLAQVPDDLTVRGAAELWSSFRYDYVLHHQVAVWAHGKKIWVDLSVPRVSRLPPPLQELIKAHSQVSTDITTYDESTPVHRCGKIYWTDLFEA